MSGSRYAVDIDPAEQNTSHALMLQLVGGDKTVLDVGCAEGDFARALRRRGCRVSGVEYDAEAAERARPDLDELFVADLSQVDLVELLSGRSYDVVVLGDVLEHLVDPVATLRQARRLLAPGGYIVISLPNVAHASVRLALLAGEFRYRDLGLLDATHLRFFTRASLDQMLLDAGLVALDLRRTTAGPFDTEIHLDRAALPQEALDVVLADPDAITYQFVLTATPDDSEASVARLRRELTELRADLDAERQQREHERSLASDAEAAVLTATATLTEELTRTRSALADLRTSANVKERLLVQQVKAAQDQAAAEAAERSRAVQAVHAMRMSTSWRLSAPVRALGPVRTAVQGPVQTRRSLRSTPGAAAVVRKLRRDGVRQAAISVMHALEAPAVQADYLAWIAQNDSLDDADRRAIRAHIDTLVDPPLISVVVPTYKTDLGALDEAIASVQSQLYPHWELCVADDASGDPALTARLEQLSAQDRRIVFQQRVTNGGIAAATNTALELVSGDFVALLDHDDLLAPHALYLVAVEVLRHPEASVIYSDEDKLDAAGRRCEPNFKPDLNPDLLLSQNCISHLGVYRTSLLRELGGIRAGVEGSQDHDLALRAVAACGPEKVRHLPFVLYHWRQFSGSGTFSSANLDKAAASSRKAVQGVLDATDTRAVVEPAPAVPSWNRVRWPLPTPAPGVTIIVPTRDRVGLLRDCLKGVLERTDYPALNVLVVDNDSTDPETLDYLAVLQQDPRVTVLPVPGPFNYAALNNRAVEQVDDPYVLLLNNDIVVRHPDWLTELVSQAARDKVGAVGAKLLYADERVQHAGVLLGVGGVANHAHLGLRHNDPGYFGRAVLAQDVSAVTGACLLTPTATYRDVGGLDEANLAVAFNDVDYCLRLGEQGLRVIFTPFAELFHLESVSRGKDVTPEQSARFHREISYMHARWGGVLRNDPAYNLNLSDLTPDFSPAGATRVVRPWAAYLV